MTNTEIHYNAYLHSHSCYNEHHRSKCKTCASALSSNCMCTRLTCSQVKAHQYLLPEIQLEYHVHVAYSSAMPCRCSRVYSMLKVIADRFRDINHARPTVQLPQQHATPQACGALGLGVWLVRLAMTLELEYRLRFRVRSEI